jgi:hypothetical protein
VRTEPPALGSCYDAPVQLDSSGWSGDGDLTQALLEILKNQWTINFVKVEDAPASRSDSSYSFISNEIYVGFARAAGAGPALAGLATILEQEASIGAPDYADGNMLQYLRTERIVPAYQTRGFKMIEMVRIYELPVL